MKPSLDLLVLYVYVCKMQVARLIPRSLLPITARGGTCIIGVDNFFLIVQSIVCLTRSVQRHVGRLCLEIFSGGIIRRRRGQSGVEASVL